MGVFICKSHVQEMQGTDTCFPQRVKVISLKNSSLCWSFLFWLKCMKLDILHVLILPFLLVIMDVQKCQHMPGFVIDDIFCCLIVIYRRLSWGTFWKCHVHVTWNVELKDNVQEELKMQLFLVSENCQEITKNIALPFIMYKYFITNTSTKSYLSLF